MEEISFYHKKINTEKLLLFGFAASDAGYLYKTDLLNGQFELQLSVTGENKAVARLMEKAFGEEYTLHLIADAAGAFVGSVRKAYQAVIADFLASCCASSSDTSKTSTGTTPNICGKSSPKMPYSEEKTQRAGTGRSSRCRGGNSALIRTPPPRYWI